MLQHFLYSKINDKRKAEAIHFSVLIVGTYLIWKAISFVLENTQPQFWIHIQNQIANVIISLAVYFSNVFAAANASAFERNIFMPNTPGIYVADHCLGIPAMVVFTLFVLFFKGSLKNKLWFIPIGVIGVLLINTFRLVALVLLMKHATPAFWELNHKYFFLAITYGFIFWMIKVWMDKFAETN